MDGKEIFRKAVRVVVESAEQAMADAGLGADDIDLLVPHQANLRIIQAACQRLGIPEERTVGGDRPLRQHLVGVDPPRPRRRPRAGPGAPGRPPAAHRLRRGDDAGPAPFYAGGDERKRGRGAGPGGAGRRPGPPLRRLQAAGPGRARRRGGDRPLAQRRRRRRLLPDRPGRRALAPARPSATTSSTAGPTTSTSASPHQETPRGTVDAVLAADGHLGDDAAFGVANADDLYGSAGARAAGRPPGRARHGQRGRRLPPAQRRGRRRPGHPRAVPGGRRTGGWPPSTSGARCSPRRRALRRQRRPRAGRARRRRPGVDEPLGVRPGHAAVLRAAMDEAEHASEDAEVLLPEVVGRVLRGERPGSLPAPPPSRVLAADGRCIGVTHPDDLALVQADVARQVGAGEPAGRPLATRGGRGPADDPHHPAGRRPGRQRGPGGRAGGGRCGRPLRRPAGRRRAQPGRRRRRRPLAGRRPLGAAPEQRRALLREPPRHHPGRAGERRRRWPWSPWPSSR